MCIFGHFEPENTHFRSKYALFPGRGQHLPGKWVFFVFPGRKCYFCCIFCYIWLAAPWVAVVSTFFFANMVFLDFKAENRPLLSHFWLYLDRRSAGSRSQWRGVNERFEREKCVFLVISGLKIHIFVVNVPFFPGRGQHLPGKWVFFVFPGRKYANYAAFLAMCG